MSSCLCQYFDSFCLSQSVRTGGGPPDDGVAVVEVVGASSSSSSLSAPVSAALRSCLLAAYDRCMIWSIVGVGVAVACVSSNCSLATLSLSTITYSTFSSHLRAFGEVMLCDSRWVGWASPLSVFLPLDCSKHHLQIGQRWRFLVRRECTVLSLLGPPTG